MGQHLHVSMTTRTTHRPATCRTSSRPRVLAFAPTFGKARVFHPEASEERCTAALLLDVDPVGLVRCVLAGRTCRLAFRGSIVQISARMDTTTRRIRRRLEKDGWFLSRRGGAHDIYRHPEIEGIVTLPRHRQVTPAVARSIARKAGWIWPATDRENTR